MVDTTNAVAFTEEQEAFREVVARFLAARAPAGNVRALVEAGRSYDSDVWLALAQELGVTGLHVPEAHGGSGFGPIELGIVLEEMGRQLYTGPYFTSSIMAGCALHGADADAQAALFPSIADGSSVAALVLDSLSDPARLGLSITASADGAHLDGTAPIVPGGLDAEVLLVLAAAGDGLGLFRVNAADAEISPLQSLDPARPVARVRLSNAPAERIGTGTPGRLYLAPQDPWDTEESRRRTAHGVLTPARADRAETGREEGEKQTAPDESRAALAAAARRARAARHERAVDDERGWTI